MQLFFFRPALLTITFLMMMLVSSFLSFRHKKATEALYILRQILQTGLGVASVRSFTLEFCF